MARGVALQRRQALPHRLPLPCCLRKAPEAPSGFLQELGDDSETCSASSMRRSGHHRIPNERYRFAMPINPLQGGAPRSYRRYPERLSRRATASRLARMTLENLYAGQSYLMADNSSLLGS